MSTKQNIMQGAREVFRSKGFAAARTQEIADHCGVNKALINYHFGGKQELFTAILQEAFEELFPVVFKTLNGEKPLREKIQATVSLYMDALAVNPDLPLFVLNEINRDPTFVKEHVARIQGGPDVFFRQVYEANVSGELYPVDPFDIITDIIGLSVIGYLARPMIQTVSRRTDDEYQHFMAARKSHAISLLMNGLFRTNNDQT